MTAESTVAGLVRVRTLGTIDVRLTHGPDDGGRAVLSQPKRFALLAYLAAASPLGFHRRDTLLGLFWPELDLAQGRHALRQALHFLRQRLGAVVIRRGDEDVGLDPSLLWCDAAAFEQAFDGGSHEVALDLYRGDFLPGFFVSGVAAEFEAWLESRRARLRATAALAAWAVAERSEREGQTAEGAAWARRAVSLAPDDESGVRRLMGLLDRIGDRSGALRAYEQFAEGLRTEFSADPAPETRELHEAVRQGLTTTPARGIPVSALVPGAPAVEPSPDPSSTDPDFDQLVGRDHVLQLLRTELRRSLAGGGEPVLVLGEAGIGKTQLARHFAAAVRAEGARCLVAHFFDYQGSRLAPYETLLDLLGSALETEGTAAADASLPLAERIRARLGIALPPELGHAAGNGPVRAPADPGQVSAALGRCFRKLSRERPLVLLLDDLQWADDASRQVVGYLMRTAVDDPLLIVGLARVEEAEEQSHPLSIWLRQQAAARGFTSVRLRALSDTEVGTQVARVFGASGGITLPPDVTVTLHQLTGGNPYFLVETIRFLLERGLLARSEDKTGWKWHDPEGLLAGGIVESGSTRSTAERLVLPASLAAAAGARLDRLSPEVRALVETAAVLGEEFRLRTLAAVEGRDEAAIEPLLAAATREGVISESGLSPGEDARFAHTLLRRACYAEVPARRRRKLHERVAETLQATYRDGLDRVAPAVAAHLAAAGQQGAALRWYLRAGRAASARGQWKEASEALERARAVADEAARAGDEVDAESMPIFGWRKADRTSPRAGYAKRRARWARPPGSPALRVPQAARSERWRCSASPRPRQPARISRCACRGRAAQARFTAIGDARAAAAPWSSSARSTAPRRLHPRGAAPRRGTGGVRHRRSDSRLVAMAAAALGSALALAGDSGRSLAHLSARTRLCCRRRPAPARACSPHAVGPPLPRALRGRRPSRRGSPRSVPGGGRRIRRSEGRSGDRSGEGRAGAL